MISIQSDRLQLIPLDHSLLTIWKNQGRKALESCLQLQTNSFDLEAFYFQEMQLALNEFWIPQTHKYSFDFCWYTNWEIILKSSSCSVGGIGFSGLPNNEGETEIGYVVDKKFRQQGIAAEAVETLIKWGAQDKGLYKIVAETPQENIASQRVLQKNLFKRVGEKSIFLEKETPLFVWEKEIKN